MQIITRQVEGKPLTVTIEYPEYNESTMRLIQKINSLDLRFSAYDDDKQIRIELSDVYYIENVERKLFIYTKSDVYRFDSTMPQLESIISGTQLVRISRTCIMNTDHLKQIRQVKNSHLEAVLDNDEMLIVSRKYLKDIKRVFKG
ncbi:MAG: LytTR family transcriptional regulator DNA-binding domain-containing protein [Lachnospiraceae bacterium]|nr:LytTR family transcriptional regulator DNA-binding domain-containing protein [Lachnospiraceae bacterium]